jgi:hypothetical protein
MIVRGGSRDISDIPPRKIFVGLKGLGHEIFFYDAYYIVSVLSVHAHMVYIF